jgi:hypothetical protein
MQVRIVIFLLSLLLSFSPLLGQLKVSNLAEYQIGNIPGENPKDQSSLYNQLNINYKYKKLSLFSRIEQFYPSVDQEKSYRELSQFKVSYFSKKFDVEVGNLYTTLGRGLLLRNYEIPSSVYEARGYRVKYGFYKDLSGVSFKYKSKHFRAKFIRGKSLIVELPQIIELNERRIDLVEAADFEFRLNKQILGMVVMRNNSLNNTALYHSLNYNGSFKDYVVYAELAQRIDSVDNVFNFSDSESFGFYSGINYTSEKTGITFEYKNYQNFLIGTGLNDPPSLIREQSSKLLNRSTHVPLINDEWGYQVELLYQVGMSGYITVNHALASNYLAGKYYEFKEYYAEYSFRTQSGQYVELFIDYSQDPLLFQPNRYTLGGQLDFDHKEQTSSIDIETQYVKSISGTESANFSNYFIGYSLSKAGKYSISALFELTTDPVFLDEGKSHDIFPSLSLSYQLDKHNKMTLFIGKRRGGPSCTSGVCYDVLDFQGVELRIKTRF